MIRLGMSIPAVNWNAAEVDGYRLVSEEAPQWTG